MTLLYLFEKRKKPGQYNQVRTFARFRQRQKRLRWISRHTYARAKAVANLTLRKSQIC